MRRTKRTDHGLTNFPQKELRILVPDPNDPKFAAETKRQGRLLRNAPEEIETLEFINHLIQSPEP